MRVFLRFFVWCFSFASSHERKAMVQIAKNPSVGAIFPMILFFGTSVAVAQIDQSGLRIPEQTTGDLAYDHVSYLSEVIGSRVVGSAQEDAAADYIIEQFEIMGYEVEVQPFSTEVRGRIYASQNIIATKPGTFDQTVIVGAHYDSVSTRRCFYDNVLQVGAGAGDNASGVGVMLEVAEVLANYKTGGTIKFVAFGAEEPGLLGSQYYAEQMSEEDIDSTVTMVDLDMVGVGDFFYVYAGWEDNPGWARDLALKIGQGMGYDLRTSPQSEFYDYGTTGDWSDHVAFRSLGIPIAYFEWMNWDIEPDGGLETEEYGWILHTCLDNLNFISRAKLEMTADVAASLVFQLSKTRLPAAAKGRVAEGNKYISIQKRNYLAEEIGD